MKDLLVLYRKAGHEKSTCPLSKGRACKIHLSFIERQGMKNLKSTCPIILPSGL